MIGKNSISGTRFFLQSASHGSRWGDRRVKNWLLNKLGPGSPLLLQSDTYINPYRSKLVRPELARALRLFPLLTRTND